MCGCTGVASPARWLRWRRRCQIDCALRRVPRCDTNKAAPARGVATLRSSSQRCTACRARAPIGTVRRLEPLPSTWAWAAPRSIQPPDAAVATRSSPVNSPMRRPAPYSSSTTAASRVSSHGSMLPSWKSARCMASSTPSALGNGRAALGARTSCTGLEKTRPSRPSQW